jgi:hypothetical protein
MLRVSCKVVLITAACLVTAARLHNRGIASMVLTTQEINRCLSVLRAAAGAKGLQDPAGTRTRRADVRDL